jgi:hypothetical protein
MQLTTFNAPKFRFPGVDLSPDQNPGIIGFLQRDRICRMDPKVKIEASMFDDAGRWSVHMGLYAESATGPLGDDYRWLTLSTGLKSRARWIPSLRLGYRENVAGSGYRSLGIGATMFNVVNIDIASGLDVTRVSGRKLPQGFMASIGSRLA